MITYLKNVTITLLLSIAFSGCSTTRISDLRDCGRFSIGAGVGLGAHLELGAIIHPAIGAESHMKRIGFEDRKLMGTWDEKEYFTPVLLFRYLRTLLTISVSYIRTMHIEGNDNKYDDQTTGSWLNFKASDMDSNKNTFNRLTDLEAGASLGVVSIRAGINPLEIVDFIFGFMGVDIAGDDSIEVKVGNGGVDK